MNSTASELSSPTLKPSDYDSIDRIAKSKLKSFFHKSDSSNIPHEETDFEDTSSSADLGLQEDIVSDVYDVKNVNPLVEEFVAKRMKIKSRPNSMVRFGSNRTKIFDKESILQVPKKEPPRLTQRDSILVVKEQNPQYLEEDSQSDWEQDIPISNPVVLEGLLRCWDACGIPESEFDDEDLIMTVQKLSYGILQAFNNQGTINRLVKYQQVSKLTEDFEQCWLDLLEALQVGDTVNELKDNLTTQVSINAKNEDRIHSLEDQIKTLEAQLEDQSTLKREHAENIATAEEANKKFQDLSSKYRDASLKLDTIQMDRDEIAIRYDCLKKDHLAISEELSNCKETLNDRETQLKRLQRDVVNVQRESQEALDISNKHCSRIATELENAEATWKHNFFLILKQREEQMAISEGLKSQSMKARQELEDLKKRNTESLITLNATGNYIKSIELQNRELNDKVSMLSSRLETLLDFKKRAKTKIVALRDAKRTVKQSIKDANLTVDQLRKQAAETREMCEVQEKQKEQLFLELQAAKKLLKESKISTPPSHSPLAHKGVRPHRPLMLANNRIDAF